MTSPKVAVVLSGCGRHDGSEIHESVLAFLAIEEAGATWDCFAPDVMQRDVIDHLSGKPMDGSRNVLLEAARIARGRVGDLARFDAAEYDALVFPGGSGGAKNLSDYAVKGTDAAVHHDALKAIRAMQAANKPIGFICITPASVAAVALNGVKLTVGDDRDDAAQAIKDMGCTHVACAPDGAVVDEEHRVVSTPAYMTAGSVVEVRKGIEACIRNVLKLANVPVVKA